MAFQNLLKSLTIPEGSGSGPRIVIGAENIPAELQAYYAPDVIVAAILYYQNASNYIYFAVTNGDDMVVGAGNTPTVDVKEIFRLNNLGTGFGVMEMGVLNPTQLAIGNISSLGHLVGLFGNMSISGGLSINGDDGYLIAGGGYPIGVPIPRWKTADTTKTNQAALFADPDINWLSVPPGEYFLEGVIHARTSNVANDGAFNWSFTGVGAATMPYVVGGPSITATGGLNAVNQSEALLGATTNHGLITTNMLFHVTGFLTVTTAGDLQLNFAQSPAAAGTSITMALGTRFTLTRVA